MSLSKISVCLSLAFLSTCAHANVEQNYSRTLLQQPGFFRFSFDNVKMPANNPSMGIAGINYLVDITPNLYAGLGAYGAITGKQGGLFALGVNGGVHHQLFKNWFGDAGLFVGGGGGRASLVGGGLMIRPYIGVAYNWGWLRLGLHYSDVNFSTGKIHSQQIGFDIDIPADFYYLESSQNNYSFKLIDLKLPQDKFFSVNRNDFSLLLQAYKQRSGTRGTDNAVQDGMIKLVGAELDHYLNANTFVSLKAAGAFAGIPNGYMDVIAGIGYRFPLTSSGIAFVPQFNLGAGGGGNVDSGGGILVEPKLGIEFPLNNSLATRISAGYLWAPKGQLQGSTLTGQLIYHLNIGSAGTEISNKLPEFLQTQTWRINLINQTYIHPQRTFTNSTSPDNLVAVQLDQIILPNFFVAYQAASAYHGEHAGGLATGALGIGIQTNKFSKAPVQLYSELLVGAGGGGGLKLGGGALISPVFGIRYKVTNTFGITGSASEIIALRDKLRTTVINFGVFFQFDTLRA